MKFFDDKSKAVKWWNRNYFYAGTIIVILVNILLFAFGGNDWKSIATPDDNGFHWGEGFYFIPTIRSFFNCFSHFNWQHVLLNMLCFLGAGLYLERKLGTFGILGFVVLGAYLAGIATTANDLTVWYSGFSGVNYLTYSYIIIDYIFSFQKRKKNKTNIILGGIIIALIYLAMCYTGGTSSFTFTWYPWDLLHNLAHGSGFVAGIALCLTVQLTEMIVIYHYKNKNEN